MYQCCIYFAILMMSSYFLKKTRLVVTTLHYHLIPSKPCNNMNQFLSYGLDTQTEAQQKKKKRFETVAIGS